MACKNLRQGRSNLICIGLLAKFNWPKDNWPISNWPKGVALVEIQNEHQFILVMSFQLKVYVSVNSKHDNPPWELFYLLIKLTQFFALTKAQAK